MFGSKKAKQDRLSRLVEALGDREIGATELAKALGVSRNAILDEVKGDI
jgi:biotin operon repressor